MANVNDKKWEIVVDVRDAHNSKVFCNGEQVDFVRAASFGIDVDCGLPIVKLEFLATNVTVKTINEIINDQEDPFKC